MAPPPAFQVSVTVPLPTVAANPVGAVGGVVTVPAGITNSVMLCEGTVVVMVLLATATSARRAMDVCDAELICQACAVPVVAKFARLTVTGVLPCCLLITITVSAPSELRIEANAERLSGFAVAAETLVSPKVEFLPS